MRRLWLLLALAGCGGDDAEETPGPDGAPGPDVPFHPIGRPDVLLPSDGPPPDVPLDGAVEPPADAAMVADLGPPTDAVAPPPPPDAAPPPPEPLRIRFEPIEQDSGALRITDLAFLPDPVGDFLLLDKDGYLIHMRMQGEGAVRLGQIHLDETWFASDSGLISITLDPDFATNRYFYLGQSLSHETNVVKRFTWDPDDLDATRASEKVIIEVTGEGAPRSWHNVGSIGFTAEGYLWALFGDKVLDEVAQDVHSPLGSLLRVIPNREPDGEGHDIPEDNPYADGSGHPAVYAKGMRSPWKGVYHEGIWYWGDIGLDTFEELNRIDEPAQNFGWPTAEGPCEAECEGLTEPWMYYGRGVTRWVADDVDAAPAGKRSVWLGCIYEPREDDPYDGRWDRVLVFGDIYPGFVRAISVDGGESWPAGHLRMMTAMRQGPDGYVYATALGTWPADAPEVASPIYRVVLAD